MSKSSWSLVVCGLAVMLACVFGVAMGADPPTKKKKLPTESPPPIIVPSKLVDPKTAKKTVGTPGVLEAKPGLVTPKVTLKLKPQLNPKLNPPKAVTSSGSPKVLSGNAPNVRSSVNKPKFVIKPSVGKLRDKAVKVLNDYPEIHLKPSVGGAPLSVKSLTVPGNSQGPKGTLQLAPQTDPNAVLKLNPQDDSNKVLKLKPGSDKILQLAPQNDSNKVLELAPQNDSNKIVQLKPRTETPGVLSLKTKSLAVPKNGIMTRGIVGPPYSDKSQKNADSGKVLQLKPDSGKVLQLAPDDSNADKARRMIEADQKQAAKRQTEVLQGLFGVAKSKKSSEAEIMALETDEPQGEPVTILPLGTDKPKGEEVTILPLGTDEPQGEPATLMQFKERDRMSRTLQTLKASPKLRAELGLQNLNLDKVSGVHQQRLATLESFANWQDSEADQQLGLMQQFELQAHGDLSRRMNLSLNLLNAGGWAQHRQHGVLAPSFTTSAFSMWYAGGGGYPAHSWCPHWSPWVDWSWWNTCPVIYDPRPYYCIPVVYDPCLPWVYHIYPVWQPLPEVACGTWLDVPPIEVTSGWDLQLLAVRFVDNGHPEQNQGPSYRVWAVNNSKETIETPVSVLLLASNGQTPTIDLPQAGVVVPWMEAGEVQVCDIRLPLAANQLGTTAKGQRVPFNYLHVLVDSHQQIPETFEDNNGAVVARRDILPVDPAAFSTDLTAAAPDSLLAIAGEGFGPEPGQVILLVGDQQVPAEIFGWYDHGVQFAVPNFELTEPVEAEVLIVRGDGAASNPLTVQLAPQELLETAEAEAAAAEEAPLPEAPLPDSP